MLEGSEQQSSPVEQSTVKAEEVTFHMPQGPDLAGRNGRQLAAESAAAGLEALPHMAEIYPLGGEALLSLHCTGSSSRGLCTCHVYMTVLFAAIFHQAPLHIKGSAVHTTGNHSVHVTSQFRKASTAATHVVLSCWSYLCMYFHLIGRQG